MPSAFDVHGPIKTEGSAISNAIYSSASILSIPYLYLRATGIKDMKEHAFQANLNANYLRKKLEKHYPVLFKNEKGF